MLGFRASWIAQSSDIWHGKDLTFDPNDFRTGLSMLVIDHDTMRNALQRCKARQTTFTGLLNHRGSQERLRAALDAAGRAGGRVSVVVIDLDHFKRINDTFGHAEGDRALALAPSR